MARVDVVAELTPHALADIRDAIVHGYDHESLDEILLFNWGLWLSEEFKDSGFKALVKDLVKYADKKGRVRDLLGLAYGNNPENPKLKAAAERYLDDPNTALAQYGSASPLPLPHSLEGLVNSRSKLFKFGEFVARVKSLGSRICRVETPDGGGGTAWLVGRSHVLTNYHVMLPVLSGEVQPEQVICRFDVWSEDENAALPTGTPVQVEAIVAKSRYSQSDISGTGNPAEDELDYALLKLSAAAGSLPHNGGERGWFKFGPDPPIVARGDIAMIPQHASGRPLEVGYGTVVELPATGMRYRYDVTTERGSSGSPVFTPDLSVYGLHHAAEPELNPKYNQAVPLWRIARDLQFKQVGWVD